MKYLTWKQIRTRLEERWKADLSEEDWIELRGVFLKAVVAERDLSREFRRQEPRLLFPARTGSRKPGLDVYDGLRDF
jgi:hypothetical protein